jgi:hypothetical protein
MPKLNPTISLQQPIRGTDGIRMKVKSSREFARARQALPGNQISAENSQDDLCNQLLANGNCRAPD